MYFSLLLVMVSNADGFGDHVCNGTIFQNEYYETQTLFKDYGKAYNLVLQRSSGNLFFSHGDDVLNRRIVSCHINTSICNNVTGIPGRAHTLYHNRHDDTILFGGRKGIYEYKTKMNAVRFVGANNKTIWNIFKKSNVICFIDYPSQYLFKIIDSRINFLLDDEEQYDNYFVSKHFFHYFMNKKGELFKIEKPATFITTPIFLSETVTVRQFAEDVYGVVYVCAKDGIYIDDVPYRRVVKIIGSQDLQGCVIIDQLSHKTIDEDKIIIIYSDKKGIHKFYPSEFAGYCKDKKVSSIGRMGSLTTPASKSWLSFSVKIDYD